MGRRKPRKPRKGRASEQAITRRGLHIYQKGDQIKALTGNRWDVASQGTEGVWHRVSFAGKSPTCECPYHTTGKGCRCKHIAAVEHTLLISSEAALGKKVDVKEKELVCPDCKKGEHTRDGWYHGKHEKRQRYKCTVCKRRFRDNLGFEYSQVPRLYITLALMLSGMGMAAANIQMTLRHLGVGVHVDTITRILEHYSKVVEEYTKTVKPPCVGDKWDCDEKHQKVRGKESYIVAVMDLATRFVLAWDISPTKEKYDAVPLPRAARDMAGRIPRLFITDGLDQYHIAFKRVFRTLKGLRSIRIRDIHIRNLICNTNKQERLNGGVRGPLQVRPRHKQGGVADIPHGHTALQLHQAAQRNRQQDARRGRRHRRTGCRQVADAHTERRIRRVRSRGHPTSWNGVDFCPRIHPIRVGLCQKPTQNEF